MSVHRRRMVVLPVLLAMLVAGMAGLAYASVPLYRLFCQVTGFGGTTQVAAAAPASADVQAMARIVTVRFDANVNGALPWDFRPAQRAIRVRPGEQALAFYVARNRSDQPITGIATYNVTPVKAGAYFSKIDCFCFESQRLEPGRDVELPVSFFVDPEIVNDRNLDDVNTITLSYTFFQVEDEDTGEGENQSVSEFSEAVDGRSAD